MAKLLCSKKEVAEALGVSLRTVDNLIGAKELQFRRVGRRVLIPVKEIERFARFDHSTRPAVNADSSTSPTQLPEDLTRTGSDLRINDPDCVNAVSSTQSQDDER